MTIEAKMIDREMLVGDYGPRTFEVRSGKGRFTTPSRALSSQEARAHMKTSTVLDPLVNPIYEHVTAHFASDFRQISKKNGKMAELISKINSIKNKHEESKLTILYPIRRDRENALTKEDLIGVVDLQGLAGFDLVSIPDYWARNTKIDTVATQIEQLCERAEFLGSTGVPYVDIARPEASFGGLLGALLQREYPIIGIEYSPVTDYYANFRTVAKFAKKAEKTILHMSRVDPSKRKRADPRVSPSMFVGLFGIDTVCVAVPPPLGGSNTRTSDSVKRFSPLTAGVLTRIDYEQGGLLERKDCSCPVCTGKSVREFYDNYSHRPMARTPDKVDPGYLHQVSKVHEAFSALQEMQKMHPLIKRHEFKSEYLDKKTDMKDAFGRLAT